MEKEENYYKLEDTVKLLKDRLKNNIRHSNIKILNRRKKKLDELMNQSDYFSEEEIKRRDPILYEIYLGSYKIKNENLNTKSESSITQMVFDEMDDSLHKENLNKTIRREMKEFGHNKIKNEYVFLFLKLQKDLAKLNENIDNSLEDETDELIRLMMLKFLMGEDREFFDYEEIDNNEIYDDIEQINQEDEEAYFDSEEPSENNLAEYTGIQDY